MKKNDNGIILNQIISDGSLFSFKEIIPPYTQEQGPQTLIRYDDGNILWSPIDLSLNIIVNNRFKDTDIYYDNGRIGIGRFPLFTYTVDLAISKNTRTTAFHIGDGIFGFSMGNGTNSGFLPEIIGVGSDEDDAGLYFVGIAGNDISSNVPLILMDGRNMYKNKLKHRPIFGITSGDYNNYDLLLDASKNLKINKSVLVEDVILNNDSLLEIIKNLQEQIDELKTRTIKLK
jgi:hypothetical protein